MNSRPDSPLIIRLRNFIGDVVLMIPALEQLESAGYELHCVGKGWAKSLLEGHGWRITSYPKKFRDRVTTLRAIKSTLPALQHSHENAITFATSFSSAMDMRFAGLRPFGYAVEARSIFLSRSAPIVYGEHAMHSYWRLANAFLRSDTPPPAHVNLQVSDRAHEECATALKLAGVTSGYLVAVPFAGGTFEKLDKRWPQFAPFIDAAAKQFGRQIVLAPGPDEIEFAKATFPQAVLLPNLSLGAYAALMRDAALTISNDTGPGHMAASVSGHLLSVLGPTKVEQWGALGPHVSVVQSYPTWPSVEEVMVKAAQKLATR